jgi:hypothetical protein
MNAIPEYPESTRLCREHRPILDQHLVIAQPRISELSFAYLWSWQPYIDCRLSMYGGTLLVTASHASGTDRYVFPPLTAAPSHAADIIRAILDDYPDSTFKRVPEPVAEVLKEEDDMLITEKPGRADYVHLASDLKTLPGSRFHSKKNLIRQFRKERPQASYMEMDKELAQQCIAFTESWLENHPKNNLSSLRREVETCIKMLSEMEWLALSGGVITDGDEIIGYALGEPLNEDTFVVRVEKADTGIQGSYQILNQQFAIHAGPGYRWINREQDLGIPGLRRAKQSYHPHHMVRKFVVEKE